MGLISDPASLEANSYVSLVEAELVMGARPHTEPWDALSSSPSAKSWVVDTGASAGATTVSIKDGLGTFTVGNVIQFAGHETLYSITDVATPTSPVFAPALTDAVVSDEVIRRLTLNEREQALAWATQNLDKQVAWNGSYKELEQPLRWPRTGVTDCDGRLYCDDCFPGDLKTVTAEYAMYLVDRDLASPPALSGQGLSELKVDVITLKADAGAVASMAPPYIEDLLGCMGQYNSSTRPGGSVVRTLRT